MSSTTVSNGDNIDVPTFPISVLKENPHEIFRRFRPELPFIRSETGVYLVLRADDVADLYSEAKTRQLETELIALRGVSEGPIWDFTTNSMLMSNGDIHRRRRGPMTRTFAFKMITDLRPHIRQTVNDLLDSLEKKADVEFLGDFAAMIPARIIASILGIDKEDIPKFTEIVYRFAPLLSGSWLAKDVPQLQLAAGDLHQYVSNLVQIHRVSEANDFLAQYIAAADGDLQLTAEEAITQLMELIIGGSDTTRSAIAIQQSILLQNPDQWRLLVENPNLIPGAVLECLRYDPSVGSTGRFTVQDIEIGGKILPANRPCALVTMSALRDEGWYRNPETLDITRQQPKWHPVFGGGAHRCLGEALAKAELEETLAVLLARFPNIKPASNYPKVTGFAGIRHMETFPVILNG